MTTSHSSMSVEDYLKSRCIEIASDITSQANKMEKQLKEEMKEARKELMGVHEDCVGGTEMDIDEGENDKENSSSAPKSSSSYSSSTASTSTSKPSSISSSVPRSTRKKRGPAIPHVSVLIESGPHTNLIAVLKPTAAKAGFAYVGRSTGKKFRESGLSLHKDLEVSTTHGHFKASKDGSIYFVDTGSTNGTFVGEEQLEEGSPLLIKDGARIRCGASMMKLTLTTPE
ncbi:hypothetical protein TrVE_jg14415 [Triparma verrucosa]|uniref:FHA domain-containing protein n=1 Tax=Triparma verrucosa TaxID=1606542 RepID=A0A9W7BPU0_9STRA|nr:hypothetical protein TrVE_jg14415 [Triparma verrucosa]